MVNELLPVITPAESAGTIGCSDAILQKPYDSDLTPSQLSKSPKVPIDSGYSSPDGPVASCSHHHVQNQEPAQPERKRINLGGRDFFRFDLDATARARLDDVSSQIAPLLCDHLKKSGERIGLISFRPFVLGATAERGHDHIVVFCPSQLSKTIENFFKKTKTIKDLCEPTEQAPLITIVVDGRQPLLLARLAHSIMSIGPHSNDSEDRSNIYFYDRTTICGRPLRLIMAQGNANDATCGGIINIVDNAGGVKKYVMTAGHVFNDNNTTSSEEDAYLALQKAGNHLSTWLFPLEESMEVVSKIWVKGEPEEEGPDFDWALFECEALVHFGPNQYRTKEMFGVHTLTSEIGSFSEKEMHQEVEMIASSKLSRPGLLSSEPARILFEKAGAFTPAYIFTINEGEG